MAELINLTPHPIRIYDASTPDAVADVTVGLIATIPPSGTVARLGESTGNGPAAHLPIETYTDGEARIPVDRIVFTTVHGLPSPREGVHLIVPLLTAIAVQAEAPGRNDLLVPYAQVRNAEGTVVGCRRLAQPC